MPAALPGQHLLYIWQIVREHECRPTLEITDLRFEIKGKLTHTNYSIRGNNRGMFSSVGFFITATIFALVSGKNGANKFAIVQS